MPATQAPCPLQSAGHRGTASSQPAPPKPGRHSHRPSPRQCPRPEQPRGHLRPPVPRGIAGERAATAKPMRARREPAAKAHAGGERPSWHSHPARPHEPCAEHPRGQAAGSTSAHVGPPNPVKQRHTPRTSAVAEGLAVEGATAEGTTRALPALSTSHTPCPEQLASQSGRALSHARPA